MFSELFELSESVHTLTNGSVEYSSSISKMTSKLESAQALLKALSNDENAIIQGISFGILLNKRT